MKRVAALCFWGVLAFNPALANPVVPTPAETLKQAQQGKTEYIEVLGQLQAAAPRFQTGPQCFAYLRILDALKQIEIEKKYGLEAAGASPLLDFAQTLTANTAKFIRLDLDAWETLEVFYRWSEDDTRARAAENQRFALIPLNAKPQLLVWHERTGLAVELVRKLNAKPYVAQVHDELQSITVKKLLALKGELTAAETTRVLSQVKSTGALTEALTFLQQEALVASDSTFLKQTVVWAIALGDNVKALPVGGPEYLKSLPGRVLIDATTKLLAREESPDVAMAKPLVACLGPSQVTELGGYLTQLYQDKLIPEGVLGFDFALSEALLERYAVMGLSSKSKDLEKLFQRFAMLRVLQNGNFEGSYAVQLGKFSKAEGSPALNVEAEGTLTIANIGSSNFVIGLRRNRKSLDSPAGSRGVDFSLFHCTYNFRDDSYESHHFAVDSPDYIPPTYRNYYMKFKTHRNPDGTISLVGRFSNGLGFEDFTALRWEKYPTYDQVPSGQRLQDVTGLYVGKHLDREIELNLTQVGQRVSGTFALPGGVAHVPLTFGYFNAPKSVVYVTSGEMESGKWLQVRGQFSQDGKRFRATYLIGGQGLKIEAVDLEKIQ